MRALLFGTGHYYQCYKICFSNAEIIGLLDNDSDKQGTMLDGHMVYPPTSISELSFDQIWLLSFDTGDMRKQLLSLGVAEGLIYEAWELWRGLGSSLVAPGGSYCLPNGSTRSAVPGDAEGKIAVLTPNLLLNGAEVALVQMVRTLLQQGYEPLVATLWDGPLREELLVMGVPVVLMGGIAHDMALVNLPYLARAKAYVLNTIEMYMLLQDWDKNIPVIWWLHDSDMVYQETCIKDESLRRLELEDVSIHVVSSLAEEAFRHHYGRVVSMVELPFGLPDWARGYQGIEREMLGVRSLTFSVVGNLSRIKSQSDFIRAVSILPEAIRASCRFCLIGAERDTELVQSLREQAKGLPVEFLGELGREELLRFYVEEMDILVCSSRNDTLPIVTVEAMMFAHPVIVSTGAGTAKMLEAGGGGLSVPVGDAKALAGAMQWMYDHPRERFRMGEQARKIYEREFTLEIFGERVKQAMSEILNNTRKFTSSNGQVVDINMLQSGRTDCVINKENQNEGC